MADKSRREFLLFGTVTGGAIAACGLVSAAAGADDNADTSGGGTTAEEKVSPAEDLMREHGLLRRILLIYEECIRRLGTDQVAPVEAIVEAAGIVRSFVEDYHEKLEEEHIFPRFRRAKQQVDLVDVLLDQHRAGRRQTDSVRRLATAERLTNAENREAVAATLGLFVRMYGPHAAREDTVLFPALHAIVNADDYDELGEDFEATEQRLFGVNGFEKMVDRIATIEKSLGIFDLAQFTPPA